MLLLVLMQTFHRQFSALLSVVLIGILLINSGQSLVLCIEAGGSKALEPAHNSRTHGHSEAAAEVAATSVLQWLPSQDCEDLPLGSESTVQMSRQCPAEILALLSLHAPVLADARLLVATPSMPHRADSATAAPLSLRLALQATVLLI